MNDNRSLMPYDASQGSNLTHRRSAPVPDPPPSRNPLIKIWSISPTLFVALIALTAICVSYFGYRAVFAKSPMDVVNGAPYASRNLSGIGPTLEQLAALPADQRSAALKKAYPKLEGTVVYFLRDRGKLSEQDHVQKVEFLFGNLDSVKAEDGDGKNNEGYFKNQLVARVYVEERPGPVDVIVQCLNGMVALPEDMNKLQSLDTYVPEEQFVIGPREGLTRHVDLITSIALAERFHLPLYSGKEQTKANLITAEQARAINTDLTQVTVGVVEGDKFDLRFMTFTPSPKRSGK